MSKRIIKAMSPNDFVEEQSNSKFNITRGVKINDTAQNLTVTRAYNHTKGVFEISLRWNMNAITGDDVIDTATLDSMSAMMMASRDRSLKWRDEWKQEHGGGDDDQIDMGFDAED